MTLARMLPPLVFAFTVLLAAASARAQSTDRDSVIYVLASPSQFEWGCFDPCACPISVRAPMTGGFLLRLAKQDPLYTRYDVLNVRWRVESDHTQSTTITGSGTYRIGGEVALMEELTLDLSFDGGPAQRFTSGLRQPGASFPEIRTRISLHAEFCFDSVLEVDAKSTGLASVEPSPRSIALGVAPNPTTGGAGITFRLPHDGVIDLSVFDLSGRQVARIVERQWLASGAYRRTWDGRRQDGGEAPAGVYRVRIDGPSGVAIRPLVKLR